MNPANTEPMLTPSEHDSPRLYAERDHQAQGDYYLRHVSAMTGEGLHAKSAIAAELAHRDMQIDALRAERDDALRALTDDARITDIGLQGGLHMTMEGGAAMLLARAFAQQFRESGAVNYLELQCDAPDGLRLLHAEIDSLKDAVRSARADEAHCWASRVDGLTAQLREVDARYMALLKAVADGRAMQPAPAIVVDLGPNAEVTGLGRNRSNDE